MPVRTAHEPGFDLRSFVRGIVVHHQMHVPFWWHGCVDPFQEIQELSRPVALVAFADHRPGGDIERCE